MRSKLNEIQKLLSSENRRIMSDKLHRAAHDYIIRLISENFYYDQNEQVYQNFQKSKTIIVNHYEDRESKATDLYFIISFKKTILLVNQSQLKFIYPLLSSNDKLNSIF